MTRPIQRSRKSAAIRAQYRQIWTLLAMMAIGAIISVICADADWAIAKGLAAGALLSFVAQCTFTFLAYQTEGARHAKQIMLNTYLGMMVKWLISIAGFALIFLKMAPIHALSVIIGFILMQLSQALGLMRLK